MLLGVAVAAVVGLVVLLKAVHGEERRRIGGLCVAAALVVALPLAAVIAGRSAGRIDVVGTNPPGDAPAWSVRCETVFQQTEITAGNNADFIAACSDDTRPRRWASYALVLLSAVLTVTGVSLAASTIGRRPADYDDSPRQEPGAVKRTPAA